MIPTWNIKQQMLSRLNFCVNSLSLHVSKNKRHKPYIFTHEVRLHEVLPKSCRSGTTLGTGHQDDNKNTYEANTLCGLTFKVFQKHTFFRIIHLQPPSPKRPVAESESPKRQRRTVLDRFARCMLSIQRNTLLSSSVNLPKDALTFFVCVFRH